MLVLIFFAVLFFFSLPYLLFFAYAKHYVKKPWDIIIDKSFQPDVTVLIPAHNEETVIEQKLENVAAISYPKNKIEIIVVDDASQDSTFAKAKSFKEQHPELNIKIVRQEKRLGKSPALNAALPLSSCSIVIVSDAETFWPPDILEKALPYLADPRVGAITGRGLNRNTENSWVTRNEDEYLKTVGLIKKGESKIQSTIRFEGGFCAYKKGAFKEFDQETGADDSGTALDVILHNYRTIGVSEAVFYTSFPTHLSSKLKIKVRRANHLVTLWLKCAKLMLKGQLPLAKKIAIPEIMLLVINPLIFLALIATTITILVLSPFSLLSVAIWFTVGCLLLLTRKLLLEVMLDNLILLYTLISILFGRRYISWEKPKF